jgi:hypothetical protein
VLSAHAAQSVAKRRIRPEWLASTLLTPAVTLPDPQDTALRHALAAIPDFGDRVLRVIYNPETTPVLVVTAYFDRSMKGTL